MVFEPLSLDGAFLIKPEPHFDERGFFARLFCRHEFEKVGLKRDIVQVNHSLTKQRGSIRGFHFQYPPHSETKIVRCSSGAIFDVIVDLRSFSPTFLHWTGQELSAVNHYAMYVPDGFAHAFQTLADNSEVLYLTTAFYCPDAEGGIRYNDPRINVRWRESVTGISEKDLSLPLLTDAFSGIKME